MTSELIIIKKIPKGEKYFSKDWINKMYEAVEDIRDKTYIMYHIETGLRVSDVVNTEVVHIDWDKCRTYTYDHKKDEWRYVYWPKKIKGQLKQWLKIRQNLKIKDKQLFPFCQKTANRILQRAAKRVKFPHAHLVSSHWCRHTFIKLSRAVGRDIKAVQQNTGDTLKTLLDWYSHLSSDEMVTEVEKEIS